MNSIKITNTFIREDSTRMDLEQQEYRRLEQYENRFTLKFTIVLIELKI